VAGTRAVPTAAVGGTGRGTPRSAAGSVRGLGTGDSADGAVCANSRSAGWPLGSVSPATGEPVARVVAAKVNP
jgi:hypothetical protein